MFARFLPAITPNSARCCVNTLMQGRIGGELYRGDWHNVGTPEQLAQLNQPFRPAV
jgi:NDP-sugar pyrophosphorylase family protein